MKYRAEVGEGDLKPELVRRGREPLSFFVGFALAVKLSLIFWLGIAVLLRSMRWI